MTIIDHYLMNLFPSSTSRLTEDEAHEYMKKYLPSNYKLEIGPNFQPCYSPDEKTIYMNKMLLTDEILLHEIGHAVMGRTKGTINHHLNNLKGLRFVPKNIFLQCEYEAWEFALKNSNRRWGIRSGLTLNKSLGSYEKGLPDLMLLYFGVLHAPPVDLTTGEILPIPKSFK